MTMAGLFDFWSDNRCNLTVFIRGLNCVDIQGKLCNPISSKPSQVRRENLLIITWKKNLQFSGRFSL
jgi:hypothetical protein